MNFLGGLRYLIIKKKRVSGWLMSCVIYNPMKSAIALGLFPLRHRPRPPHPLPLEARVSLPLRSSRWPWTPEARVRRWEGEERARWVLRSLLLQAPLLASVCVSAWPSDSGLRFIAPLSPIVSPSPSSGSGALHPSHPEWFSAAPGSGTPAFLHFLIHPTDKDAPGTAVYLP